VPTSLTQRPGPSCNTYFTLSCVWEVSLARDGLDRAYGQRDHPRRLPRRLYLVRVTGLAGYSWRPRTGRHLPGCL